MKISHIALTKKADHSKKTRDSARSKGLSPIVFLLLFALLIQAAMLSGCKKDNEKNGFSIVCTSFPAYDFARQLTSNTDTDVALLISPGTETHSYEPTPQDIIKIQMCDIFICTGGESESWLDGVLSSVSDRDDMTIIKMLECVSALEEEPLIGIDASEDEHGGDHNGEDDHDSENEDNHAHDNAQDQDQNHDHDASEHEYDEHVWTSPKNAILISEEIGKTLSEKDSENASIYSSNLAEYKGKLEKLDSDFREAVNSGARKTLVFGDRYPFLYFAKEYGLTCYAAFPGCSSETEPIPSTVAFLIDKVKSEEIPVVLYLEMSNTGVASAICESTGAQKMLFHSCHNVSKEELSSGATYISLMEGNLAVLKKALG